MTELLEILYGAGAVGTGFVLARHLSVRFRGAFARLREQEGAMRWLSIPAALGIGSSFFLLAVMLWPAALIWLGWDRRDLERFETREESEGYRRLVREIRRVRNEEDDRRRAGPDDAGRTGGRLEAPNEERPEPRHGPGRSDPVAERRSTRSRPAARRR